MGLPLSINSAVYTQVWNGHQSVGVYYQVHKTAIKMSTMRILPSEQSVPDGGRLWTDPWRSNNSLREW